ncbi:MAG TPA: 4Fe-4S dicluster domain-containing protein [Symbiobacteriaceae bacterium]|nr:4Fe-4S dicluster domain-containing protein [Symbiobacteriaceae bacterium]
MKQVGFYMDMQACYGCQTCEIGCKSQNQTPEGVRWRQVRSLDSESPKAHSTLSMGCNHCESPECLRNCPVGAYTKREKDGLVIQDHNLCIGCRMCVMACPYGAPQYDAKEGKVSKCNGCVERVDKNLAPRCADVCPGKALVFGDLTELQAKYGQVNEVIGSPRASITHPSIVIRPTAATRR